MKWITWLERGPRTRGFLSTFFNFKTKRGNFGSKRYNF